MSLKSSVQNKRSSRKEKRPRHTFLADNVKDGVDELSALGVVDLGPVVSSTVLAKDKVVGAEELAKGTGANRVHGSGLQVHQDGAGHIAATRGLVEVHVDALQLQVGVTVVRARGVDTVLIGDNLPELGTCGWCRVCVCVWGKIQSQVSACLFVDALRADR